MSFLFISLPWLSNGLLWSINKLKQGLWCTIWQSHIYIYIYVYIYIYIGQSFKEINHLGDTKTCLTLAVNVKVLNLKSITRRQNICH